MDIRDADVVEEMLDNLQEEKDIHDQIADVISRPGTEMFDDVRNLLLVFNFPSQVESTGRSFE